MPGPRNLSIELKEEILLSKYDKAAAAAIASAFTAVIGAITALDTEVVAAIGVIINSVAVYLVPNKE